MIVRRQTSFRVRGGSRSEVSATGDRRKCQTYTASPAVPGGLPVMLERGVRADARQPRQEVLTLFVAAMLAKSPDRKRAVEYLAACGAVPITVIERDGVCSISCWQDRRHRRRGLVARNM